MPKKWDLSYAEHSRKNWDICQCCRWQKESVDYDLGQCYIYNALEIKNILKSQFQMWFLRVTCIRSLMSNIQRNTLQYFVLYFLIGREHTPFICIYSLSQRYIQCTYICNTNHWGQCYVHTLNGYCTLSVWDCGQIKVKLLPITRSALNNEWQFYVYQ